MLRNNISKLATILKLSTCGRLISCNHHIELPHLAWVAHSVRCIWSWMVSLLLAGDCCPIFQSPVSSNSIKGKMRALLMVLSGHLYIHTRDVHTNPNVSELNTFHTIHPSIHQIEIQDMNTGLGSVLQYRNLNGHRWKYKTN